MPSKAPSLTGLSRAVRGEVRVEKPRWADAVMQEVAFVELHIGRWRAKTNLLEADLGLPRDVLGPWKNMVELGMKRLLPRIPETSGEYVATKPNRTWGEQLDSEEQAARYAFRSQTFPLTRFGHAIMLRRLPEFEADLEKRKARYFALRDEIAKDWDKTVSSLLQDYRQFAEQAAERAEMFDSEIEKRQFVDTFLGSVEVLVPPRERFLDSFRFEWDVMVYDLSSWVAMQSDPKVKREIEEQFLTEMKQDPARAADVRAYEKIAKQRQALLAKQAAEVDKIREEVLREFRVQFTALVYDASVEVLEALQERSITPNASRRIKKLLDILTKDSLLVDADAKILAERVSETVLQRQSMTNDDIRNVIRQIATVSRATLLELDESPRTARDFGVPDVPPDRAVRQARSELLLPLDFDDSLLASTRQNRSL